MRINEIECVVNPWRYPNIGVHLETDLAYFFVSQTCFKIKFNRFLMKCLFKGDGEYYAELISSGGGIRVKNKTNSVNFVCSKPGVLNAMFRHDESFIMDFIEEHIDKTPLIIVRYDGGNYNTKKGEFRGVICIYDPEVGTTQKEKEDYLKKNCPLYVLED